MAALSKIGSEEIVFEGNIFQVIKQKMSNGKKTIEFETARRSPGVRLIIQKGNMFLLTREFRSEYNSYDYRLPGGKVFDLLSDYKNILGDAKKILSAATSAAKRECVEETGISPNSLSLYKISKNGATVEWDLYYFLVTDFVELNSQNLELGEDIVPEWKTIDEIKLLCKLGKIKEDRTVGVLFSFFEK